MKRNCWGNGFNLEPQSPLFTQFAWSEPFALCSSPQGQGLYLIEHALLSHMFSQLPPVSLLPLCIAARRFLVGLSLELVFYCQFPWLLPMLQTTSRFMQNPLASIASLESGGRTSRKMALPSFVITMPPIGSNLGKPHPGWTYMIDEAG